MSSGSGKVKRYGKELGLSLVEIPRGSKGPIREGWNKGTGVSWKKWKNGLEGWNAGILHSQSKTICLDIDDLSGVRNRFGESGLGKVLAEALAGDCGLVWSSGVENRVKVLFKISKKLWKKMKLIGIPGGLGQIRGGRDCGLQDVIVGTHPSGTVYKEICCSDDLSCPKWFEKELLSEIKLTDSAVNHGRGRGRGRGRGSGHVFIDVYNKWYTLGVGEGKGDLLGDIMKWSNGGYEWVLRGSGGRALRRVGSNNNVSVVLYSDSDGIDRVMNFSDHVVVDTDLDEGLVRGGLLLPYGVSDPYDLLVLKMGYDEARQWVCGRVNGGLGELVDEAASGTGIELYRMKDIVLDPTGKKAPSLTRDIKFPKNLSKGFVALVESICWHQQGIYNEDIAFWYSLVFADWLIGGGYNSIGGTDCEPLYVFTAGPSGMGKSVTMKAGNIHIKEMGGSGSMFVGDGLGLEGGLGVGEEEKTDEVVASSVEEAFRNKRRLKNVKTAEGLEDLLTSSLSMEEGGLDHGCDVLFVQDEYGLKEGGTMDSSGRNFRATILDYKTLSRTDHVEPRLLATRGGGRGGVGGVGGVGGRSWRKGGVDRYCVHFNYYTTTTIETLKGVLGDAEVGSGYLQRFIGGGGGEGIRTRKSVLGSSCWMKSRLSNGSGWKGKGLLKMLRKIVKVGNSVYGLDRVSGGVKVGVTVEAEEYIEELLEVVFETKRNDREPLAGKMVENMYPLAKLIAIFRWAGSGGRSGGRSGGLEVELEDVKWAHTVVSCSIMYFKWLLKEVKVGVGGDVVSAEVIVEKKLIKWLSHEGVRDRIDRGVVSRRDMIREAGVGKYGAIVYGSVLEVLEGSDEALLSCVKGGAVGSKKVLKVDWELLQQQWGIETVCREV